MGTLASVASVLSFSLQKLTPVVCILILELYITLSLFDAMHVDSCILSYLLEICHVILHQRELLLG